MSEWKPIKGATTAPKGYEWVSNGKSRFSKDYRHKLSKIEKTEEVTT